MTLTLLPNPTAGDAFTFLGANQGEECEGCPFTGLCFKLEPLRHYEVITVRAVKHPCKLHDGDQVTVVEVVEAPIQTSVETKLMRGTATKWQPIACGRPTCSDYKLCHPRIEANVQYQIKSDDGAMDCPEGFALTKATLQR